MTVIDDRGKVHRGYAEFKQRGALGDWIVAINGLQSEVLVHGRWAHGHGDEVAAQLLLQVSAR